MIVDVLYSYVVGWWSKLYHKVGRVYGSCLTYVYTPNFETFNFMFCLQISTNPFASRDDSQVYQKSGLLEVKTTMTKAISLVR